jgi:hypothetical protein
LEFDLPFREALVFLLLSFFYLTVGAVGTVENSVQLFCRVFQAPVGTVEKRAFRFSMVSTARQFP